MSHVCQVTQAPTDPKPFVQGGQLNFKAHDVGWIICGFMTAIASVASFWLIWKHLTYYTCPQQQRHIVRMLFMVPIYAIVSTLSYIFFKEAIYYQTIRDCYEAVVITSFFYLLAQYVGDTPAEQHEVFRMVKLKKWFFPLGAWKYRPSGLHFYWLMKICILQYAIIRPLCTLIAVVMQYFQIYCYESWAPYFGHIYITIAISLSVTVAMYALVQFYLPIKEELEPFEPILKFICIKSIVFLTFWQDSFLSILVFFKVIKPTQFMTAEDIQVGYDALLETTEMVIFAFLHIKAFTYVIYRPADHKRVTRRWRAFLDVLDYRDWYYQMMQTTRYIAAKSRGRDFTIAEDIQRARHEHLQKALGNDRWSLLQESGKRGTEIMPSFWAPGCEPRDDEEEQQSSIDPRQRPMPQESQSVHAQNRDRSVPQYLAAMDPAYDPEAEDDRALDEYMPDDVEMRRHEMRQMLPTLPPVDARPTHQDHARSTNALQSGRSSGSSRYKPLREYRDDLEMDKPSRAGLVTAGPKSYLQSKMKKVANKLKQDDLSKDTMTSRAPYGKFRQEAEHEGRRPRQSDRRDVVEPRSLDFRSPDITTRENIQAGSPSHMTGPQSQFYADKRRSMPPLQSHVANPVDLDAVSPSYLPAPSQLIQRNDVDPFSAARGHASSSFDSPSRRLDASTTGDRPLSLQVGSVISPRELAAITAATEAQQSPVSTTSLGFSHPNVVGGRSNHAPGSMLSSQPQKHREAFRELGAPRLVRRYLQHEAPPVLPRNVSQSLDATRDEHLQHQREGDSERREGFHFEYLD